MMRSKIYVCPICGNIIHSMGEAVIQCHGIVMTAWKAEETDEKHKIFVEKVEDEYYVRIEYEMSKQHYISFIAASSVDNFQMVKLYPEQNAEARFKIHGIRKLLFYCNRDGLYSYDIIREIDDKQSSYDNTEERRMLEQTEKKLFG